ncbi:sensor domain-containing protein, partial [Actinotalea ferrariae]|uniref:sensor domain-containing protein n=1 Tax=Actinotalea ferrariae TaxID=1386098 RepID=UPI001C8B87F1
MTTGDAAADLRVVAPALLGGHDLLRAPVSSATWRAVSQASVGSVVLLLAAAIALAVVPVSVGLLVIGVGMPLLLLVLVASAPVAALERARLRAHLGVEIAPPAYAPRDPRATRWWRGWGRVAVDPTRWGHVLYAVVGCVLATTQLAAVTVIGGGGLALVAIPAYRSRTGAGVPTAALVVVGLAAVWLAAVLVQLVALGQVRLARGLLG